MATPKLNAYYHKCAKVRAFTLSPKGDLGERDINFNQLYLGTIREYERSPAGRAAACCGITELIFLTLQRTLDPKKFDKEFDVLIANWIKLATDKENKDNRVLFTGIPVKAGSDTNYNLPFYKRLAKSLVAFGFKQMTDKPYKNYNSKNQINAYYVQR